MSTGPCRTSTRRRRFPRHGPASANAQGGLGRLGRALSRHLPRLRARAAREGSRRPRGARGAQARQHLREARPGPHRLVAAAHGHDLHGRADGGDDAKPLLPLRADAALAQPRRVRHARRDPPRAARPRVLARPAQARRTLRLVQQGLPHQRVGRAGGEELLRRLDAERQLRRSGDGHQPGRSSTASPTSSSSRSRPTRWKPATSTSRTCCRASRPTRRATRSSASRRSRC